MCPLGRSRGRGSTGQDRRRGCRKTIVVQGFAAPAKPASFPESSSSDSNMSTNKRAFAPAFLLAFLAAASGSRSSACPARRSSPARDPRATASRRRSGTRPTICGRSSPAIARPVTSLGIRRRASLHQVDGWPDRRSGCRLERPRFLGHRQHPRSVPHGRGQGHHQ